MQSAVLHTYRYIKLVFQIASHKNQFALFRQQKASFALTRKLKSFLPLVIEGKFMSLGSNNLWLTLCQIRHKINYYLV